MSNNWVENFCKEPTDKFKIRFMSAKFFSTCNVESATSLKAFTTPPKTAVEAPKAKTRALEAFIADSKSLRSLVILPKGCLNCLSFIFKFILFLPAKRELY